SLDETDITILSLLQKDARMQNATLAREVGMAPSAVLERVRKLEEKGVIQSYCTKINPAQIDLKLLAFIFIKSSTGPGNENVGRQLAKMPEVLELHNIAGDDCYIIKVRSTDPQSLAQFMRARLGKIEGIISTRSTIVLETLKEDNYLPIPKA
ncbi:MAG TPA: Lrp/AsnC family transcriptional regulator, partial [Chitinophagaceae bacterium]|nr:Lrp/AsnC family transcriptional regulator [Chitinophagaceae bacterium]